jgi:hypothetical protein
MNWFEKDGKELAELIYKKLSESKDKQLTKYEVWDIVDSNLNYGLKKTLHYASKYIKELNIEQSEDGGLKLKG